MPKFSQRSIDRLETCRPGLVRLFMKVIESFDCTILEGHRGEAAQNKAYDEGKSKLRWPNGKHNKLPSLAVDVAPYPVDWNDLHRFYYFAGYVMGIAQEMGIKIRWGGDWDGDKELKDNSFNDLVHFEILE